MNRLPKLTLAQCAEAGTLAFILMESRCSIEQTRGLMERLNGWDSRAGRSIYEEAELRSRNICNEAEKRLTRLGIETGRTGSEALDLWRELIEYSYRCEP